MTTRTTQVTVMCQFEQVIDIPEDIQTDEEAIQELIEDVIASDEMLLNCVDSGEVSRVTEED